MSPLSLLVMFVLLLIATVTDLRSHRIYNWTTYPGLVLAFLLRGLDGGSESAQEGVAGAVACGGLMLVCFQLFDLGGGDLKLMTMIGAFLGWQRGLEAVLWTFILGGIAGVAFLIWQQGAWHLLSRTLQHLGNIVRYRGWVPITDADRVTLRQPLFLAPAALLAAGITNADFVQSWWQQTGS